MSSISKEINNYHAHLLGQLITGYLHPRDSDGRSLTLWKIHFRQYSTPQLSHSASFHVLQDFDHLEKIGELAVGKYDVLKDIFRKIDVRAVKEIEKAEEIIEKLKERERTVTDIQFENTSAVDSDRLRTVVSLTPVVKSPEKTKHADRLLNVINDVLTNLIERLDEHASREDIFRILRRMKRYGSFVTSKREQDLVYDLFEKMSKKVQWLSDIGKIKRNVISLRLTKVMTSVMERYSCNIQTSCGSLLLIMETQDEICHQKFQHDIWNGKLNKDFSEMILHDDLLSMFELNTKEITFHLDDITDKQWRPYCNIFGPERAVYGEMATFNGVVWSHYGVTSAKWQKIVDGKAVNLEITDEKYTESTDTPPFPKLVIKDLEFKDQGIYQLLSSSGIAHKPSNQIFFKVAGGVPKVIIMCSPIYEKKKVIYEGLVEAEPPAIALKWQKIVDKLHCDIDINYPKYKGSSEDLKSPKLVINNPSELDNAAYLLIVSNKIGIGKSNAIELDIKGDDKVLMLPEPNQTDRETLLSQILNVVNLLVLISLENKHLLTLTDLAGIPVFKAYDIYLTTVFTHKKDDNDRMFGVVNISLHVSKSKKQIEIGNFQSGITKSLDGMAVFMNKLHDEDKFQKVLKQLRLKGSLFTGEADYTNFLKKADEIYAYLRDTTVCSEKTCVLVIGRFAKLVLSFKRRYGAAMRFFSGSLSILFQFGSRKDYKRLKDDCKSGAFMNEFADVVLEEECLSMFNLSEDDVEMSILNVTEKEDVDADSFEDLTPNKKRTQLFVAAIDIGASFSGFVFSTCHEWSRVRSSPNSKYNSLKFPTVLLLNPDKSFNSFGYEAEEKYAELKEYDEDYEDYYYFNRFPIQCLRSKKTIDDECNKPLKAKEVLIHTIEFMVESLMQTLSGIISDITLDDIYLVLTIDVTKSEDQSYRQLFIDAASDVGIKDGNMSVISGAEAVTAFLRNISLEKNVPFLSTGTKYIILDAGGSHTNLSLHERSAKGSLDPVKKLICKEIGGNAIFGTFIRLFEDIFGEEVIEDFKSFHAEDFLEFERDFMNKMKMFSATKKGHGRVYLRLPFELVSLLKVKRLTLSQCIQQANLRGSIEEVTGKLRFEFNFFKSFFQPTIDKIVRMLQDALEDELVEKCEVICLVGGFSCCELFQTAIKEEFSDKLIIAENSEDANLRGALFFGHLK